jgi:hypothetical protein
MDTFLAGVEASSLLVVLLQHKQTQQHIVWIFISLLSICFTLYVGDS